MYWVDFYTDNFKMDDGKTVVSSKEPDFLNKAKTYNMIFKPGAHIHWIETPFASGKLQKLFNLKFLPKRSLRY